MAEAVAVVDQIGVDSLLAQAPSPEDVARANALKDEGNALLQNHRYIQAAEKYTEALELHKTAIFYSNRAQALIKLENYGSAIMDANEALKLDPKYIKAYYRRGSANFALNKLKQALKDFKAVVAIVPKDPDALKKMKACDKAVKEEAFAKAIEAEELPEEVLDAEAVLVDDSYKGPRLAMGEDGKPVFSAEFVSETMEYFRDQKLLHRKYVIQVLQAAIDMFKAEPSLLRLFFKRQGDDSEQSTDDACDGKISAVMNDDTAVGTFTVCGDTHGQYYDLCNIFKLGGLPSEENRYLFNGDYVDRGSFSFENVFSLILLKLSNPRSLHMLRGNHETKNMNKIYGFVGEVKHKYDDSIMNLFNKIFQALPLAAVIENKVFVVHGGLSTGDGKEVTGVPLSSIENLTRNREPPESGLMSDLLWADPQPQMGRMPSKRGLGFSFGPDYTNAFLSQNNLQLVIRSHEVKDEGYVEEHDGKCITVFSAPNYCDQMGNKGAYIRFDDVRTMSPNFTKFDAVPHPNVPPMRYAGNMFAL